MKTDIKIEKGKFYRTRSGEIVEIVNYFEEWPQPWIAKMPSKSYPIQYWPEGLYFERERNLLHGFDLIAEWQDPEPAFVDVPISMTLWRPNKFIVKLPATDNLGGTCDIIDYAHAVIYESFMGFVYVTGNISPFPIVGVYNKNDDMEVFRPVAVRFKK